MLAGLPPVRFSTGLSGFGVWCPGEGREVQPDYRCPVLLKIASKPAFPSISNIKISNKCLMLELYAYHMGVASFDD